ncbi:MAG: DUF309 domain-containing protein [Roseiflexaceae bacterium]|nr:DUF309 domain-containing protein [Roseiflexaceae bacterium]
MTEDDTLAEGLQLFNAGAYWHAHEVWEQGWLRSEEPRSTLYKGIIQAAAALVHWQRGNLKGLQRNWYKARPRLVAVSALIVELDITVFITAMDHFVITEGAMNVAPRLSLTDALDMH